LRGRKKSLRLKAPLVPILRPFQSWTYSPTLNSFRWKIEDAAGVARQELRPDMIAERKLGKFAKSSLEVDPKRIIARIYDLVGSARVGEIDDWLRYVFWREARGRVVQVWPFKHQLHGEIGPRLATVTHDDLQLGKIITDLINQLDMLSHHLHAGPRHANG